MEFQSRMINHINLNILRFHLNLQQPLLCNLNISIGYGKSSNLAALFVSFKNIALNIFMQIFVNEFVVFFDDIADHHFITDKKAECLKVVSAAAIDGKKIMKMKLAVFIILVLFFNFFHQMNCEIRDNGCQDWNELLQDQNMTEVSKENLYRFQKKDQDYSIYLGNDPLTIWLDLGSSTVVPMRAKAPGYPHGSNPNAVYQVHGRPDCQAVIIATENGNLSRFVLEDNRDCFTACTRYQGKYTPFTMWSENGPVEVYSMLTLHDGSFLKLYLPENQMVEFTAAKPCKPADWIKTNFPTSDYTHLKTDSNEVFKNESGISFVHLNNDGNTVVWVEIKDSAPEHYVIIQPEDDSQLFEEDVVIGLEANGVEPVSFDAEKNYTEVPNGVKIYLKKVICVFNNNFLGHIRYVFNINSTANFTATFFDVNDNNLELKYLDEEKVGIPKPYDKPYQFEYFTISSEPPTTTTSSTSTSTSTSTTQSSTTTSTIQNVPHEIGETSAPVLRPKNEIQSEAAQMPGFFFSVFIAILMAQKLFIIFV